MAMGLVTSCSGDERFELFLNLRTDLLAGREFTLAEVFLQRPGTLTPVRMERVITDRDSFLESGRLAEFEGLGAGFHRVIVHLRSSTGELVAERPASVQIRASRLITILITRDCRGVLCEDPERAACLQGMCVSDSCTPETTESCPEATCRVDGDCGVAAVTCAESFCAEGACFLRPKTPSTCSADMYCNPDDGCRELPTMDAGATDAALDATPDVDGGEPVGFVFSNLPTDIAMGASGMRTYSGVSSIDTDADCTQVISQATSYPELCVIAAANVQVDAAAIVTVTGNRPLVLVATVSMAVLGDIVVAGRGSGPGPGASASLGRGSGSGSIVAGHGGGGNGTEGSAGGDGSIVLAGGAGGSAIDGPLPSPLIGGGSGGGGGAGGGALQLSSAGALTLEGTIDASGGGGPGGGSSLAGSGGGAGGSVLIEAMEVTIGPGAFIAANGGAGGAGGIDGTVSGPGQRGEDGRVSTMQASNGTSTARGGLGCALEGASTVGHHEQSSGPAGGGGGGCGRIHIRYQNSSVPPDMMNISPPAVVATF